MKHKKRTLVQIVIIVLLIAGSQGLAAPGDLDPTFGVGGRTSLPLNVIPRRIRFQPDGKILVLGTFAYPNTYSSISRFNPNGTPDLTFGDMGTLKGLYPNDLFYDFWLLPDGRILVTGMRQLLRLNPDGTRDTTFSGSQSPEFLAGMSIAVQPDGKILVVGAVYDYYDDYVAKIIRFLPDGTLDPAFGPATGPVINSGANELIVLPDSSMLTTGGAGTIRFSGDGTLDTSFGVNGVLSNYVNGVSNILALDSGRFITNGAGQVYGASRINRYETNGHPDQTFGVNGVVTVATSGLFPLSLGLAVQRNGKILTAGQASGNFAIARYYSGGSPDTTFGSNGLVVTPANNASSNNQIFAIAVQPDGNIVAVGNSLSGGNYLGLEVIRYLGDPVSATVTISGRVSTPNGQSLRNATVVLTDASGSRRLVTTSSFGIYSFENVLTGSDYTVSVASKRYRFQARTVTPGADITGFDLIGLE